MKQGWIPRDGTPNAGYSRFVASMVYRRDRRWPALMKLVARLDDMQGGVMTQHGRFDRYEFNRVNEDTAQRRAQGTLMEWP